jgi:hypothetical protein
MRLEEIKQALAEGRKVYHGNKNYEVIQDKIGQYLIVCSFNGYTIGLTHSDKQTMNGKESDFFTETPKEIREAQTRALIEDIMSDPRPEDLPKIYQGLEHYFARERAEEIARQCKVRGDIDKKQERVRHESR